MPKPTLYFFLILFWLLSSFLCGTAQLTASFTADKTGGCSPVAVTFTNTSSGTSANAIYQWDFGNGNTSTLVNTSAIFTDEKTYTVTLTLTDGGKTSVQSNTVTVYKKPTIDFSVSAAKGCAPFAVTFTGNATAGDGTVADYFWDFGDGSVYNSSSNVSNHSYIVPGMQSPSLTVTNSHGCQSVLLKEKILTVLPSLVAAFSPKDSFLCTINDSAFFINKTSGPGNLSYSWDFGDGGTSSNKSPFHIYKKPGGYVVSLTVKSDENCVASSVYNTTINVGNFKPDFDATLPYCRNESVVIRNTSFPVPESSDWFMDNNFIRATVGLDSIYLSAGASGPHTIKLVVTFGKCKQTIEKIWTFSQEPNVTGFIADITKPCGAPVIVNFTDTAAGIIKNTWLFGDYSGIETNSPSVTHNYTYDGDFFVQLVATNAAGCKTTALDKVSIRKRYVFIKSPDIALNGSVKVCGIKPVSFYAESQDSIITYLWKFGDGSTATGARPVHTYTTDGDYKVSLSCTFADGCTVEVENDGFVNVRKPLHADFTMSTTDMCGNTPVFFEALLAPSNYVTYSWNFGDDTTQNFYYQYWPSMQHKYEQAGIYTVSLLITDLVCADTMVKKNILKISPPFPRITGSSSTCEGTRGEVTFTQASTQTDSWLWNFGDGQTQLLTTDQPEIKHVYTKTGFYKVILTNKRGACTVSDSIYITVLLKQYPILKGNKTTLCNWDEYLELSISNMEKDPSLMNGYNYNYSYYDWHYSDGTRFEPKTYGDVYVGDLSSMPYIQNIKNLALGKDSFALVVHEPNGCTDSTNYIPIKVKGPDAYIQAISKTCVQGNTVFLKDSSTITNGVPIKLWQWSFAYMRPDTTMTNVNEFAVSYTYPGTYPVQLKVTDAEGCVSYAYKMVDASMNALKAGFTNSATTISPGSSISFTNTTVTSDAGNTQYAWSMGDGTAATSTDVVHTYIKPGVYTIRLIAKNLAKGCIDTAFTTIIVKFVNAAFSINSSFISNSKCPPVLVRFNNTSNNVAKILWDFGDGTVADNVFAPAHIYTKPGKYIITLNTWSDNGTLYTTKDSVEIAVTAASFKPDTYYSCNAKQITLNAASENITSYTWDFGDGLLQNTTDSFATHLYNIAGVYNPQLMVTDIYGCNNLVKLDKPLVIDYLSAALPAMSAVVCTPKQVFFNPAIVSIAGNQSPQNLVYHWNFGTGKPADTSNIATPSFLYTQPGNYTVKLKVQSAFGCSQEVTASINALQGLGAQMNGPANICQGTTALFTGSTLLPGQPQWKWIFDNGSTVEVQNPPERLYNNAGVFQIQLIVSNQGCEDTLTRSLLVNENPVPVLSPQKAQVCEGAGVTLTAAGGTQYKWLPSTALNTTVGSSVVASPVNNIVYTVVVTNTEGCTNKDSVAITVVHPFTLQTTDAVICSGKSVQLNVTGATFFNWIGNTATLSNTMIAMPLATPATTSLYTVVGIDASNCFADTATVIVTVNSAPTVDGGAAVLVMPGNNFQLQPVYSNDVTGWTWTPEKYLSCSNCAAPVVKPYDDVLYTISVTNAAGCKASDTVSVNLLCTNSRIYIPTAFSPNNDGINEKFVIKGQGIRLVHHLVIYNRYGQLMFERSNFHLDDTDGAWDGRYKGQPVPAGSYVYLAEMSCDDHTFTQKGSVIVMY